MVSNKMPILPVLLVDDEEAALRATGITLEYAGINNLIALQDSREVLPLLDNQPVLLMLLDLNMPHLSGEQILEAVSQDHPEISVIIITGINDLETAVNCMRSGAIDYIVKPLEPNLLVARVRRAIEFLDLTRENSRLKRSILSTEVKNPDKFAHITTNHPTMLSIFRYVEMVADTSGQVLITGETGVGKESIALALHNLSQRKGKFVSVNAGGLDDTLFADTLFGHERGAYTGAEQRRSGLIEKATGGTLFLDEIGDLDIRSQIRLLRLLQEGEYYPLGADVPRKANARVIVTTFHDLRARQKEGTFRKDLYYRLNMHQIHIPPLRERLEDIPLLLNHFLEEAASAQGKKTPTAPPELAQLLSTYRFPGNIRELQSMVFDAVARHSKGTLSTQTFRKILSQDREFIESDLEINTPDDATLPEEFLVTGKSSFPTLKSVQRSLIKLALERTKGNQTIAAELLGISRQALNKRLKNWNS